MPLWGPASPRRSGPALIAGCGGSRALCRAWPAGRPAAVLVAASLSPRSSSSRSRGRTTTTAPTRRWSREERSWRNNGHRACSGGWSPAVASPGGFRSPPSRRCGSPSSYRWSTTSTAPAPASARRISRSANGCASYPTAARCSSTGSRRFGRRRLPDADHGRLLRLHDSGTARQGALDHADLHLTPTATAVSSDGALGLRPGRGSGARRDRTSRVSSEVRTAACRHQRWTWPATDVLVRARAGRGGLFQWTTGPRSWSSATGPTRGRPLRLSVRLRVWRAQRPPSPLTMATSSP